MLPGTDLLLNPFTALRWVRLSLREVSSITTVPFPSSSLENSRRAVTSALTAASFRFVEGLHPRSIGDPQSSLETPR